MGFIQVDSHPILGNRILEPGCREDGVYQDHPVSFSHFCKCLPFFLPKVYQFVPLHGEDRIARIDGDPLDIPIPFVEAVPPGVTFTERRRYMEVACDDSVRCVFHHPFREEDFFFHFFFLRQGCHILDGRRKMKHTIHFAVESVDAYPLQRIGQNQVPHEMAVIKATVLQLLQPFGKGDGLNLHP